MKLDAQYKLINYSLRLTRGLGVERRARLLTLLYSLYQVIVLGHEEVWLRKRLLNLPLRLRILAPFPYKIRSRLWGVNYSFKEYRAGYVHPGVLRYLDVGEMPDKYKIEEKIADNGWPQFIMQELQDLSNIEPQLFPDKEFLGKFHSYVTPIEELPGRLYSELYKKIQDKRFDAFVIVPWVREGGADKGILQYLEYYRMRHLDVLLITTYPAHSTWLDRAHEDVVTIELGLHLNGLLRSDQEMVLARLILQKRPAFIHIVQSELGYRVARDFCKSFRALGVKLLVSIFTHEIDRAGKRIGYAQEFIPEIRLSLDGVISDNKGFLDELHGQFVTDIERSFFVPFYVDDVDFLQMKSGGRRPTFLWASRFCQEKLPEVLLDIALKAIDVDFYVYGEPDKNSVGIYSKLENLTNVFLMGKYKNFSDIASERLYSGFIYTSKFDGTPNVLLEAAIMGFAVIAPSKIGGIGDLISNETGYPIPDAYSSDLYVDAIREIVHSPKEAGHKGEALRGLVLDRHSKESFVNAMDDMMLRLDLQQNRLGSN